MGKDVKILGPAQAAYRGPPARREARHAGCWSEMVMAVLQAAGSVGAILAVPRDENLIACHPPRRTGLASRAVTWISLYLKAKKKGIWSPLSLLYRPLSFRPNGKACALDLAWVTPELPHVRGQRKQTGDHGYGHWQP